MADNDVIVRIRAQDAGALKALGALMRALDQTGRAQSGSARAASGQGAAFRRAKIDTDQYSASQRAAATAVGALSRRVVAFAAAFVGVRAMQGFVRAGVEFNTTIETSTLGIGSLISAQSELTDSTGRTLSGTEKLNAALQLSTEQVRALRVAGIQTAATTEQLVEAFQQAVGAGLAAGLSLDQIRETTIQIVQAAGALGVPFNQLNQEVRSILDGTIDINSRVAKALGITNEMVRAAREQGRLAEFLADKFGDFALAGERVALTLPAIRSNLQDALALFAGEAVAPLFDRLKRSLQGALTGLFDFETAELTPAFRGLIQAAREVFGNVGDLLGDAIDGAVRGAQELSTWLATNRAELGVMVGSFFDAGRAAAGLVADAAGLVAHLIRAGTESGVIAGTLKTASDTIQFIRENVVILAAIGAGVGLAKLIAFIGGLSALPTALGLAGLAIVANPIIAVVAALGALALAVNVLTARQEAAVRAETQAIAARAENVTQTAKLTREYSELSKSLASGTLKGDELVAAQKRLTELEGELIALNPAFRKAIQDAGGDYLKQAEAIREVTKAEIEKQRVQATNLKEQLAGLRAQREEHERTIEAARQTAPELNTEAAQREGTARSELRRLDRDIAEAEARLKAVGDGLATAVGGAVPLPENIVTITPKTKEDAEAAAKAALNDLKQRATASLSLIRASLANQQKELDQQLESAQLSYREHAARVTEIQLRALDEQIALQKAVLAKTTDSGDRARILADIQQLEDAKTAVVADGTRKRIDLEAKLAGQVQSAQVQLLRAEGSLVAARALELEEQFKDLIARLVAEGDTAGVELIRRLIRVDLAKTRGDELAKSFEASTQRLSALQATVSIAADEIQTRQQIGLISERQARRELASLYQQQRQALAGILTDLQAIAGADPSPEMRDRIREVVGEVGQLDLKLTELTDDMARFKGQFRDAFESSVSQFLGTTISEVNSLGGALLSLAQSIVQSVQQIVGSIISQRITDLLFAGQASAAPLVVAGVQLNTSAGALATSGGILLSSAAALTAAAAALAAAGTAAAVGRAAGAASAAGFASGGFVRGPGTGTSDSIPARLSAGEYVVNAEATRRNLALLEMINSATRPVQVRTMGSIPHFAAGGLVSGSSSRGGSESSLNATIGLEDGLVLRHLESAAGEQAVIRVLQRNPGALRAALGRG